MKARIIAAIFILAIAVAPGCSKKCKNQKWIEENVGGQMKQGPGVQCHAVVVCEKPLSQGGGLSRKPLEGGNDPLIIDRHRDSWNKNRCEVRVKEKYESFPQRCSVESSPEIICLDAAGGPDGSDGRSSTGIFVTVGVASAGSGDYLLYDGAGGAGGTGGLEGAAGAGGLSAMPRAEGQGEI